MSALRYQLLDDGRILVTLNRQIARLEPHEIKRFAWGVLSDLDPEGAAAEGYQAAPIVLADSDAKTRDTRRGPWQIVAILRDLAEHPHARVIDVARRTCCHYKTIGVQLSRLKTKGWVQMSASGRAYLPATWIATDAGLQALKLYEPGEDALAGHFEGEG